MTIHPTACIAPGAQIGDRVTIGPHAVIGENVSIGEECTIGTGAVIDGWTTLGPRNRVSPYVVIGTPPQDLKFTGEKSSVAIGEGNTFREFVTINRATHHGGGVTRIGDNNFIMAYAHIAHDCTLGNNNIMANASSLAGHITVQNNCSIGGLTGVHQFVNIGSYCFVGGCSAVSQDILPFALAAGNHAVILGMNVIGLKRQGFTSERLDLLKKAYRILFRSQYNRTQAVKHIKETFETTPDIELLLNFIAGSQRGFAKGAKPKATAEDLA